MTQEKTKETEKVEENSVSLELTLGSSSWKKLQAAMCGKTSAAMPTMPMMPIVPMMLVIPIIPCFPMYPSQMYQTAQAHQDLPIEIEGVDAEGNVVVIKMVKDSSIT